MSEFNAQKEIEKFRTATLAFCDALDAATQTLRNNIGQPQTYFQRPQPKTAPRPEKNVLSPKLDELLKYERDTNGVLWAKAKTHMDTELFKAVCADIEAFGGKYVKGKGWELP